MDYRLLTKINNKWQQLDLGDEKPSMNYVQNDISDLKDRRSNYSHKLQLPLSNNNLKILGMLDKIEVMSDIPNSLLPCLLYCNEYEIVGSDGLMQIISVSNDNITVQLMSGIVDLFEKLKNSKMSDLDLGTFKSEYFYFLPEKFTDFCRIGIASFQKRLPPPDNSPMLGNTLPFAHFIKIVDKMLETHGYTMNTNIRNEVQDVVLPVVVPPEQPKNYGQYFVLKAGNTVKQWHTNDNVDNLYLWELTQNLSGEMHLATDKRAAYWQLKANHTANIIVDAEMLVVPTDNPAEATNIPISITILKDGAEFHKESQNKKIYVNLKTSPSANTLFKFTYDFDRKELLKPRLYSFTVLVKFQVKIQEQFNIVERPFLFLPVPISSSLGFDTQLNMLKAFVNAFGLFVGVDNEKKVLIANTFQKIVGNKIQQIDWTNKVDMGNFDCEFHNQNFAIHNHIRFEDNTKDEVADTCTIDINDKTLQYEKDIAKLPFEAGIDDIVVKDSNINAAFIPIITNSRDSENKPQISVSATKPHLCILGEQKQYDFGAGGHFYRVVKHYKTSDIKKYYAPLFETLKQYRKITLKMLLKPQDLTIVQQQIPVYLQQFGSYFYINSVKNYVCGQLAEVELMRI